MFLVLNLSCVTQKTAADIVIVCEVSDSRHDQNGGNCMAKAVQLIKFSLS